MSEKILVCGGAGYIGSHMVRLLVAEGCDVVVLDDLSTGHREAVDGVDLVEADVCDGAALDSVFESRDFDAVMHFCAKSQVGESVQQPLAYYDNNVAGSLSLLQAMQRHGVAKLVFSSSAAIFGEPVSEFIDETHPTAPVNPYGHSKLMVERILADACAASGLRAVSLRYFNAAGASLAGGIGESHDPETHLIPNVLKAAGRKRAAPEGVRRRLQTRDGTCIRDYIHVDDLARAHLAAFWSSWRNGEGFHAFNLGSGQGFSVLEVIRAAGKVVGSKVPLRCCRTAGGRRGGAGGQQCARRRAAWVAAGD